MGRVYTGGAVTGGGDLQTASGLTDVAAQAGLDKDIRRIYERTGGEDPERIFSGGVISDVFDSLNLLQHGVTGTIQGMGFRDGIRTKASFTKDDNFKDAGIPGAIAGLALDIAVDPLTYIAPWTVLKNVGKFTGASKALSTGAKAAKGTKVGGSVADLFGHAFVYRYGQDPVYKVVAERTLKNIARGTENIIELVRPIAKLDPADQRRIAAARKAGTLDQLPRELLERSRPAFQQLDKMSKRAVRLGLISEEVYRETVGRYMTRLYKTKEGAGQASRVYRTKQLNIGEEAARLRKRKDIPEDVRMAMGEILEAGYPTAKGMLQLNALNEKASFFRRVARVWGKKEAASGLKQLPNTNALGELAGLHVPEAIAKDLAELTRVPTSTQKLLGKVVGGFKFGKVILNPATHVRNMISNMILNNFEGLSPARLDIYAEAASELKNKGKWFKEAKNAGLGLDTFAAQEIKGWIDGPEGALMAGQGITKKAMNYLAGLYQKEEEWAKMAQYIFQRKQGKGITEAWQVAERATFNYAQVTPFIRRMRESIFGFPFITFTYKATPNIVRAIGTKPTKISNIGKIKNAIENQADVGELTAERGVEPPWVRDGFYMKLPMKDEHGRSAYFDLTYILPFGDLITGNFFERQIDRNTGQPEGIPQAALQKTPFLNIVKELSRNQDFFGQRIWRESDGQDKQLRDIFTYLTRSYAPPLIGDQLPGGYYESGERRPSLTGFPGGEGRLAELRDDPREYRSFEQELLRQAGLKITPFDVERQQRYRESDIEKAMVNLLRDKGIINNFNINYVPKDKKQTATGRRVY